MKNYLDRKSRYFLKCVIILPPGSFWKRCMCGLEKQMGPYLMMALEQVPEPGKKTYSLLSESTPCGIVPTGDTYTGYCSSCPGLIFQGG